MRFFIFLLLILQGCNYVPFLEEKTNAYFICDFVESNSLLLFREEIERVQINYFKNSKTLMYNFERKDKFYNNGNLFIHIFPVDTNKLSFGRKQFGFTNENLNPNLIQSIDNRHNYLIKNLDYPFNISEIRTGQSKNNRDVWDYKKDFAKDSATNKTDYVSANYKFDNLYFNKNYNFILKLITSNLSKIEVNEDVILYANYDENIFYTISSNDSIFKLCNSIDDTINPVEMYS